jgi:hypothetical protein
MIFDTTVVWCLSYRVRSLVDKRRKIIHLGTHDLMLQMEPKTDLSITLRYTLQVFLLFYHYFHHIFEGPLGKLFGALILSPSPISNNFVLVVY